jgi:hypothetical protein
LASNQEQIDNLLELGDPENFGVIKKYITEWLPTLAGLIQEDQNDYLSKMNDTSIQKLEVHKQYLLMISPEKLALLTIREIMSHIFKNIYQYQNNRYPDQDIFNIKISSLKRDLATLISKEILFESETKNFKLEMERRGYSKSLVSHLKSTFEENLKHHMYKGNQNFLSGFSDNRSQAKKIKVAEVLINYGTFTKKLTKSP